MLLLDDLYKIVEFSSTPDTITAVISLSSDHKIFEGHFPDAPVTPGVVQLQIVKELLEKHLGKDLRMKIMRTCKFIQVLDPRETPEININIKYTQNELLEISASGSYQDITFFKAQVSYI